MARRFISREIQSKVCCARTGSWAAFGPVILFGNGKFPMSSGVHICLLRSGHEQRKVFYLVAHRPFLVLLLLQPPLWINLQNILAVCRAPNYIISIITLIIN